MAHAFTHHERPKRLECHGISRWRSGSRDVLALDAFLVGEISGASDAGHPAGLRAKIAAHIARLLCCRGPERHAHGESLADQTPLSASVPAPTKVRPSRKFFQGTLAKLMAKMHTASKAARRQRVATPESNMRGGYLSVTG